MKKSFLDTERLTSLASRPIVALFVVLLLLVALPVAVWLDLASISERTLRTQANTFDRVMTSIRNFYSSNIVNRVLGTDGRIQVVSNYHEVPGGTVRRLQLFVHPAHFGRLPALQSDERGAGYPSE